MSLHESIPSQAMPDVQTQHSPLGMSWSLPYLIPLRLLYCWLLSFKTSFPFGFPLSSSHTFFGCFSISYPLADLLLLFSLRTLTLGGPIHLVYISRPSLFPERKTLYPTIYDTTLNVPGSLKRYIIQNQIHPHLLPAFSLCSLFGRIDTVTQRFKNPETLFWLQPSPYPQT